ncbi:MAG: hypothetical protein GY940_44815, partial [bacterium]|nr:hypothetical protein [bacterium]
YPFSRGFTLDYNQNYMEINFEGTCFTNPETVNYKYRLKGIDTTWFETRNRSISYPSLNPGSYTFQVLAVNNDGKESSQPAELSFRVMPPFWETWWFRGLGLIFIAIVILLTVLWQFRRVKARLAMEAKNKQLEMAQRMELMGFLAGGAVHDLKNLLSIIIGYSKMLTMQFSGTKEGEGNIEALDVIKDSATTAVQVVKQVLSFASQSYDETTAINLPDLITELLESLKITMPPEIKTNWNPESNDALLFINPVKLKQLLMMLCINAFQAMPEGGELDVSFSNNSG